MIYIIIIHQCDCYIALIWPLNKIRCSVLKILYDVMCECSVNAVYHKLWQYAVEYKISIGSVGDYYAKV